MVQITEPLSRQKYSEQCQTFKTQRLKKKKKKEKEKEKERKKDQEPGHFDKLFVKNTKKEAMQGNILEFSLLDTLKAAFLTHQRPVLFIYTP